MTLTVPIEEFAAAVQRVLGQKEAYVSPQGRGSMATASKDGKMVVALAKESPEILKAQLGEAGMSVFDGQWRQNHEGPGAENEAPYIAAVAYVSAHEKPGLWVDAYPEPPTGVQVLRAMYDEFVSTGELDESSFEEFLRLANANIVILSPADLRSFVLAKEC